MVRSFQSSSPRISGRISSAVRFAALSSRRSRRLEVIVVVDGRDPDTCATLAAIGDRAADRSPAGSAPGQRRSAQRWRGPRVRARWVAFLDDDDEWMPSKLERQIAVAERATCAHPIVSCRILARNESGDDGMAEDDGSTRARTGANTSSAGGRRSPARA